MQQIILKEKKNQLKGDCEINTEQTSNGKCRKKLRVMWSGRIGMLFVQLSRNCQRKLGTG